MNEELKKKLWAAVEALRLHVDVEEYKHIVLGLVFLKYISDSFEVQRQKLSEEFSDPNSESFISKNLPDYEEQLEVRAHYTQANVFWVPQEARWSKLRVQAKQPDIASRIDDSMVEIEEKNETLRGKLDQRFGGSQLGEGVLGELIELISTIGFGGTYSDQGFLGEIYEYFLGEFISAEGRAGGKFYTPSHVVKTLVEILSPTSGLVYDPCCGSGGMLVQSEQFVQAHGERVDDISIYGQESNPTIWRLAAMNLAIRGLVANLGKEPADTFARDQFPDLKFDYVMANPPFNVSDWGGKKYESDPRWQFGCPPVGNANYAWLQHILWKLSPGGSAGVVLTNGAMNSNTSGEGEIREAMVRGDVVEVMVALPGQLFSNTQIPVCLWFMTNDKTQNGRDRRGETLFIDARELGTMETQVLKVLTDEDIAKIANTVHVWKTEGGYEDIAGFCKSSSFQEIEENGFVLTPGRYVGTKSEEEVFESFSERIYGGFNFEIFRAEVDDGYIYYRLDIANEEEGLIEAYKKIGNEFHFPFHNEGKRHLVLDGFDEIPPLVSYYGFGFRNRVINSFFKNKLPESVEKIVLSNEKKSHLDKNKMIINIKDLDRLSVSINQEERAFQDTKRMFFHNFINKHFPELKFRKLETNNNKDLILRNLNSKLLSQLTADDVERFGQFYVKAANKYKRNDVVRRMLLNLQKSSQLLTLQEVIRKYKELLEAGPKENIWQEFFEENIALFDNRYITKLAQRDIAVGVRRIPDLVLVDIYGYIDFYELKRSNTELLKLDKHRNTYYWSTEMAKAIAQVANYLQKAKENAPTYSKAIREATSVGGNEGLEVNIINPRGIIVAGSWKDLTGLDMQNQFKNLRESLKDIEFLLYDELLGRLENLLKNVQVKLKNVQIK